MGKNKQGPAGTKIEDATQPEFETAFTASVTAVKELGGIADPRLGGRLLLECYHKLEPRLPLNEEQLAKAVTKYGVPAVSAVVAIDDVATARHKAATAAGYPADVAWWVGPVLDAPHQVVDQAVAAVQQTAPMTFRQQA